MVVSCSRCPPRLKTTLFDSTCCGQASLERHVRSTPCWMWRRVYRGVAANQLSRVSGLLALPHAFPRPTSLLCLPCFYSPPPSQQTLA